MAKSSGRPGRARPSGNGDGRPERGEATDAQRIAGRLRNASDRMADGERQVARASHARLTELLAELPNLPPNDAWRHVLDPDLVPEDRERLELALIERTAPARQRGTRDRSRHVTWPSLPRPSRSVRRLLIALAPLGVCTLAVFAVGWWRTPVSAQFVTDATVEWRRPDGSFQTVRHRAGSRTLVRRSTGPGTVLLAVVPGRSGFAVARVEPSIVGR